MCSARIMSLHIGRSLEDVNTYRIQRASDYLHIDPVGILMMNDVNTTTVTTIEMIVNYSIQLPARFVENLTKTRATTRSARHTQALHHLSAADYLAPGQQFVISH